MNKRAFIKCLADNNVLRITISTKLIIAAIPIRIVQILIIFCVTSIDTTISPVIDKPNITCIASSILNIIF